MRSIKTALNAIRKHIIVLFSGYEEVDLTPQKDIMKEYEKVLKAIRRSNRKRR